MMTMIERLDRSRQRLLATVILAFAVAAVLGMTVLPIWNANASRQETLDDLKERLHDYQRIAYRDASLLPRYRALRQSELAAGHYLKSGTPAVAGAELQRRVKDIAADSRAQIISTQILPFTQEAGFVRISLKVRIRGASAAILEALYGIETDDVYMFIESLTMQENALSRRVQATELRPMDAELKLTAYMPDSA